MKATINKQLQTKNVRVDGSRLWNSLMDLALVGATPKGGNCRLALTEEDRQGRNLVSSWLRDAGLEIRVDQIGNIFARRPGHNNELLPVVTGSHIDTQPTGGRFDGNYGVLAGLEVMRVLNEHNITTEAPLEVVIWTNEEGSRFVPVMMGSGAFAGIFSTESALAARDHDGISVADSLDRIGYAGDMPVGQRQFGAYFEAHIEQGPVLEQEGLPVGVVTGSLGISWFDVVVTGQEAHAGPTPMEYRRDALQAACALVGDILTLAQPHAPHGRVTCGEFRVFPNSRNVIPGRVNFSVDLRHLEPEIITLMERRLQELCEQHDTQAGIEVQLVEVQSIAPTPFAQELVDRVRACSEALAIPHRDIVTGAGHDAVYISRIAPTAMIFVPCVDGISHNECEDAKPEDLEAGANVLLHSMLASATLLKHCRYSV